MSAFARAHHEYATPNGRSRYRLTSVSAVFLLIATASSLVIGVVAGVQVPSSATVVYHEDIAYPNCSGFTESSDLFTPNTGPFPIPCSDQTFYRYGPPEHKENACCSDEGRVAVQLAQVGGFDITYKNNNVVADRSVDYRCVAYTEALRAVLCDPQQSLMLRRNQNQTILRICQSTCQAVFEACGLPGVNYPSDANYTDGTSLCLAAWGGWNTTPCEANSQQWACQTLSGVDIVDDDADKSIPCLPIIYPSEDALKSYRKTGKPPDNCVPSGVSSVTISIVILIILLSLALFGILVMFRLRNRRAREEQFECV